MADEAVAPEARSAPDEATTSAPGPSSEADSAPLLESRNEEAQGASSPTEPSVGQRAQSIFNWNFPWRSRPADGEDAPSSSGRLPGSGTAAGTAPGMAATIPVVPERTSSRAAMDIETGEIESSPTTTASRTTSAPVCLICLETLAPDDFASGRAISLGCNCRGDLALRHKDCAQKWAQVKDDGRGGVPICELCKNPAKNLPPLPPRPHLRAGNAAAAAAAAGIPEDIYSEQMAFASFAPSTADLVFDCIRVTWVAMIVSILFFEASLSSALWTGLVAGLAYAGMVRVMYRQHFEAMRAFAEQQQQQTQAEAPPQVPVVRVPPPQQVTVV